MIDTHCHFDMMGNPEKFIAEQENIGNTIIGMTNLPSHFMLGRPYVQIYKHIRLALGFHPLYASNHRKEVPIFIEQSRFTSYIGEIGLDSSKEGKDTINDQVELLKALFSSIDTSKKICSVHSRGAEKELLTILKEYDIKNVIFHWYSGPLKLIDEIIDKGYYFSINESMTLSIKGQKIIGRIPKNRIVTETDSPYNRHCSLVQTYKYLKQRKINADNNFKELINSIR